MQPRQQQTRSPGPFNARQATVIGILLIVTGCLSIICNAIDLAVGTGMGRYYENSVPVGTNTGRYARGASGYYTGGSSSYTGGSRSTGTYYTGGSSGTGTYYTGGSSGTGTYYTGASSGTGTYYTGGSSSSTGGYHSGGSRGTSGYYRSGYSSSLISEHKTLSHASLGVAGHGIWCGAIVSIHLIGCLIITLTRRQCIRGYFYNEMRYKNLRFTYLLTY